MSSQENGKFRLKKCKYCQFCPQNYFRLTNRCRRADESCEVVESVAREKELDIADCLIGPRRFRIREYSDIVDLLCPHHPTHELSIHAQPLPSELVMLNDLKALISVLATPNLNSVVRLTAHHHIRANKKKRDNTHVVVIYDGWATWFMPTVCSCAIGSKGYCNGNVSQKSNTLAKLSSTATIHPMKRLPFFCLSG